MDEIERIYEEKVAELREKIRIVEQGGENADYVNYIAQVKHAREFRQLQCDVYAEYLRNAVQEEFELLMADAQREAQERTQALKVKLIEECERERLNQKERFELTQIDVDESDAQGTRQTRKKLRQRQAPVAPLPAPSSSASLTSTAAQPSQADADPDTAGASAAQTSVRRQLRDSKKAGPPMFLELNDDEVENDLATLAASARSKKKAKIGDGDKAVGVPGVGAAAPAAAAAPVLQGAETFYEQDRLYYNGRWFYRGTKVSVEFQDSSTPRFVGFISFLNHSFMWVRQTEGQKLMVQLAHLAKGKVTIRNSQGKIG